MPSKCICHMRVLRRPIEMNTVLCFTIIQPRTSPEISSPLFYSCSNYSQRLKFPLNLPVNQTRHQYGCYSNPHIYPTSYNEPCLPIISPQDRSFTPSNIHLPTNHSHTNLTFVPGDRILAQWEGTMPRDGLMLLLLHASHTYSSRSLRILDKPPPPFYGE